MDLREVITGTRPAALPDQNLVNPAKVSSKARPVGFWKSIGLDILTVSSAALFGATYFRYLTGGAGPFFLIGALAIYGVLVGLQGFLMKSFGRRFLIVLLEIAGLLGFFFRDDWHILLATAVVLVIFLFLGYVSARKILENSIEVPFFRASRAALGSFVTGILAFVILAYVPTIQQGLMIPSQSFRVLFDWSAGVTKNFYPSVALNGTFSDFAQSIAKMELANNPNFQKLSPQAQSSALAQAADQVAQGFQKSLPAPVAPTAPASDAFYGLVSGMLSAWQSQYPSWFAIGWGVILFFALRSLGILFILFVQMLLVVVYEVFLASGFIRIIEETHPREIVGY